jgi:hypothetical protein
LDALRYVILRHENIAEPHFDLMFEISEGGLLATWRSDVWPIDRPTPLLRLADHRRDYLTYEGPVSGDRGAVRRVESGRLTYRLKSQERLLLQLEAKGTTHDLAIEIDATQGEPHWTAHSL